MSGTIDLGDHGSALEREAGAETTLPPTTVTAKRITPRQRARTAASIPEPPPAPPPPPPQGPELDLPVGVARQPRAGVMIVGTMPGGTTVSRRADYILREMGVTNNRFFSADAFSCSLALPENDADLGRGFWQDVERLDVEFFAGFGLDEPPSTSLLAGRADEVQVSLDGRTVTLRGRDYTADLIEMRISEKYPNKTASEIVTILAGKAGLGADVTATQALAGSYYKAEHAQLADETTAWSLITYLAEREGFDALVRGRTVIFGPPPAEASAPHWTVRYQEGEQGAPSPRTPLTSLSLTKSLTISRDIVVKVISWNSGSKRGVEGISRSRQKRGRASGGRSEPAVDYVFRIPGLTQDQADAEARRRAETLTKNLRSFDLDTAALPGLDIRSIVTLTGTGGSFDTAYHLDTIEWQISQGSGFTMRVAGRNVVPDDTASL